MCTAYETIAFRYWQSLNPFIICFSVLFFMDVFRLNGNQRMSVRFQNRLKSPSKTKDRYYFHRPWARFLKASHWINQTYLLELHDRARHLIDCHTAAYSRILPAAAYHTRLMMAVKLFTESNANSSFVKVTSGVPEGAILSRFVSHMGSLEPVGKHAEMKWFVDDVAERHLVQTCS